MAWLRTWSDLSLRAKGLIVVAVPAVATVASACAAFLIENRSEAADLEANQAMRIIEATRSLKSSETEVSAHIHAYFITGDISFWNEVGRDAAHFDDELVRLAKLVDANPKQRRQVLRVGALHGARMAEISRIVARSRSASLSAKEPIRSSTGTNEMRRLEMMGVLNAMEGDERELREAGRRMAVHRRSQLRAATLIFGLTGVVGGALISLLFASGITGRIERLRRNVARLKSGRPLAFLPDGKDEIGALSEGLTAAAELLDHRAAALENALHGIAQADAAGRYISFNKAFGELLGFTRNSAPATIASSVLAEDWWKMAGALERMRLTGRAETEVRMVRSGGGWVSAGVTLLPMPETGGSGCYVFLRDITRQKEVEAALVAAKNAALAASRAKHEFLAKVSHDIRTPLNAIMGAADLLSRTPLNPEQSEYVAMFQRNCRRLVSLINGFLDLSKIQAGMVKVESVPFRVRETADDAVATFRDTAFRKGVRLYASVAAGVPEWELGDPARLQQVLVNLLSNALKFTDAGHVALSVGAEDGRLHFDVSDTGPGIAPEDRERIFAPFIQLPNQNPGAGAGSGLGLAICKELVDLMGGTIAVTSELGHGSSFHFSLPLRAVKMDPVVPCLTVDSPPLQWPPDRAPARILIADDAADNRLLLAAFLRDVPVEIRFAADGRQAVDAVRGGGNFDLILMDIDMPEMDGYQATAAILDWQRSRGIEPTPIVALSAYTMHEAVSASLKAGCVAHLAKPVTRNTLLDAILHHARHTQRKQPLPATLPAAPATVPTAPVAISTVPAAISTAPATIPTASVASSAAPVTIPTASVASSTAPATVSTTPGASPTTEETLASGYLATKPAQIQQARDSLAAVDFAPIRRFGHNLKGTGCGYGFPRIGAIGLQIEQAATEGDAGRIAGQLEALSQVINEEARKHAEALDRH